MNATHADDGVCPENTEPCSFETTGMNTICLPNSHKKHCPITDIQFLTDTTGYEDYTLVPFADVTLAYTKTEVDSPPITSAKVGPLACLSPKEYDLGTAPLNEYEKDSKKKTCSKVDEAYVRLENF